MSGYPTTWEFTWLFSWNDSVSHWTNSFEVATQNLGWQDTRILKTALRILQVTTCATTHHSYASYSWYLVPTPFLWPTIKLDDNQMMTMNLKTPQSLMASFASAIDVITQRFCCRPISLSEVPSSTPDIQPQDTHESVNEDKSNAPSPEMRSQISKEILIPTLEHDCRVISKPRRTVNQRKDTSSTSIVGPPTITRFPNPWVLIAQETPKKPVAIENRPFPSREINFPMPQIPSLSPIEMVKSRQVRSINLAP